MMDPESQRQESGGDVSQGKGCCKYTTDFMYACFFSSSESGALRYVRFFNFVNALALFLTGLFSLLTVTNIFSVTFYFMCFYVMLFGLILCCFEMRFKWAERRVRESFGFLYTFLGRTIFLLFLASFCFGLMGSNQALGLAMGICTSVNALFNMVVMYRHGKFYENPSDEYGTAEDTTSMFMRQNPELAANAMNAGMSAARNNPQLARQGMEVGAQYARDHPQEAATLAQGAYHGSSVYQT